MLSDVLCSVLTVGGDAGAKALSPGISHAFAFLLVLGTVRNVKYGTDLTRLALNSVFEDKYCF